MAIYWSVSCFRHFDGLLKRLCDSYANIWAPHMKRTFFVCGNLCCFHLCFSFVENQITWISRVKTKYCENLLIFCVCFFFSVSFLWIVLLYTENKRFVWRFKWILRYVWLSFIYLSLSAFIFFYFFHISVSLLFPTIKQNVMCSMRDSRICVIWLLIYKNHKDKCTET